MKYKEPNDHELRVVYWGICLANAFWKAGEPNVAARIESYQWRAAAEDITLGRDPLHPSRDLSSQAETLVA